MVWTPDGRNLPTLARAYYHYLILVFLARLQTCRALIFSRVCLSVCLWPPLLPFNVIRFWRNLVTRTLLWSSLAATIMVQIGRRGTARRFFENFKNSQKSQNSNFKILVHHFLRLCLLCIVKKFRLDSNKSDGGDTFWSFPLWRFRQWHCCSSTTLGRIFLIEPAARRRAAIEARGHSELGAQSGHKNQPAC